jgi:hypothetical protein
MNIMFDWLDNSEDLPCFEVDYGQVICINLMKTGYQQAVA